jgi:hypothetical protein
MDHTPACALACVGTDLGAARCPDWPAFDGLSQRLPFLLYKNPIFHTDTKQLLLRHGHILVWLSCWSHLWVGTRKWGVRRRVEGQELSGAAILSP